MKRNMTETHRQYLLSSFNKNGTHLNVDREYLDYFNSYHRHYYQSFCNEYGENVEIWRYTTRNGYVHIDVCINWNHLAIYVTPFEHTGRKINAYYIGEKFYDMEEVLDSMYVWTLGASNYFNPTPYFSH